MSGMKDSGVIETVRDSEKQKLQPPRKYKVILNNDDYTPMDFVIEVLMTFFNMDSDRATDVMLQVHHNGKAICGIYSADVAYTKVEQVNRYARDNEHPLLCSCEQE
ncbi:ATP-dependent Clp protease adapter ClpS [Pseudoalteromonas lipolytica]|jgi:ATP-dependent Clp protease adaptor protein ClpS|uniref:ATP-dependent Clp protease adapter protein ClpS n=2 Tax=Pseudoalteromonas TaxID=53246 RepID=A0AAD0WCF6_9GAMM|nr:ATP-dependent Clp protease adapter ClpS [Pseudoalteromonas donghaensis]EWH07029.1 Clp protease ClpS [Pseudoalteromonas lipolytica SCSIO 04301]MAE02624.1 ATP-dependent Clp protease adapter ClpS [Pseudoalteromonas sp.]SFT91858.1 ATP-dependent Clp protease adaptor protein ClpS [Pseudoalteromonas lipolytica]|tara:strand:- start:1500 stop:1817 length:318 start_codon:yes stop_codon:yes gene_type:complete